MASSIRFSPLPKSIRRSQPAGRIFLLCYLFSFFFLPAWLSRSDELLSPICQVQGPWFTSPLAGQVVRVRGVVTADLDLQSQKGFFVQQPDCDSDPGTSDGIFVHLGQKLDLVDLGSLVEVSGTVQEFFGRTQIEAVPEGVQVLRVNRPLPRSVALDPPFDEMQARSYLEGLEGMRVHIGDARVVGPTSARSESFVVESDLGMERVFRDDERGVGAIIRVDGGGPHAINPPVRVGDRVIDLSGVLDYSIGAYRLLLLAEPIVLQTTVPPEPVAHFRVQIATLNLHNLFDTIDDPATDDPVRSPAIYRRQLKKLALTIHDSLGEPLLVAVQEVENGDALQALVNRPEIQAHYEYLWQDGPDGRGIDIALLYRVDSIKVLGFEVRQGCTRLMDGLGPDGNRDARNPVNLVTCDSDGDGRLDGNRLFSRPPFIARLQICEPDCVRGRVRNIHLIANHWKSKSEDTPVTAYTLARRKEQARYVAGLVTELMAADPGIQLIVLGDFNDFLHSEPLQILERTGLVNLLLNVPHSRRYTFIFEGVSQNLDHILVSPALLDPVGEMRFTQIVHINADFPTSVETNPYTAVRATDHDPVLLALISDPYQVFLPSVLSFPSQGSLGMLQPLRSP